MVITKTPYFLKSILDLPETKTVIQISSVIINPLTVQNGVNIWGHNNSLVELPNSATLLLCGIDSRNILGKISQFIPVETS